MRRKIRRALHGLRCAVLAAGLPALAAAPAAARDDVLVPGHADFPESLHATADGTLYFSSMAGGRILRAAPGAAEAKEWIPAGTNGLSSVVGLLADERSGTLYACSSDMTGAGVRVPSGNTPTALVLFDLKTGAPKGRFPFPPGTIAGQSPFCNDIAVAEDGTAYATDTLSARILRLRPGAAALEVWARDPQWEGKGPRLDGIAIGDGAVYVNFFEGDGLFRVAMQPDGSAGAVTKLKTSRPLVHADGLRPAGPNTLLMVEGEGRGTLDLITIRGEAAEVRTIRDGFQSPVSLARHGDTIYVLDVSLKYLFDPKLKSQTPPPFRAIAVAQPK
ncbi:SMP-30/gluconolactonase/LRE family protein [Roseicella sp. DB1501]|uniref:SMP-30/gluconolactonase/LRE family protein n=1 Tax=Roseicella sp. DB1501 TaxID=2730925 RepID=UPI001492CC14|nr:hypothetical protein [Roseicella sp. DB1501]NOG71456.1 hypothetical protein [Roseicella sp. DB1501]